VSTDEYERRTALADIAAMADHLTTDATAAHEMIAQELAVAVRGLGITSGARMLVHGVDPEVFCGLPVAQRWEEPGTIGSLTTTVPEEWPVRRDDTEVFRATRRPTRFDVVVFNAPYADVTFHDGLRHDQSIESHAHNLIAALAFARPGGVVAGIVGRGVLDDPEPTRRLVLHALGDLLGAARLPAGALRRVAGCDSTADIVLFRRRPDGETPRGPAFTEAIEISVDGVRDHWNEYLDDHPDRLLGRIAAAPTTFGDPHLTVEPGPVRLASDLRATLSEIVADTRERGLAPSPPAVPLEQPPSARRPGLGSQHEPGL
jgi:hypothetical protein